MRFVFEKLTICQNSLSKLETIDGMCRGINCVFLYLKAREDKGDREGIPHTHPIPWVIRLELFLTPQISRGIRQQPITQRECVARG